uniref:hypothetical protein n=1 Tax=Mariniflexile sp. TaxID=1979402 RepID=UPI0040488998
MNKLVVLLFILIVLFIGCDGRKTKSDLLKESVTKFKDSLGAIEIVEYIPEKYSEVKTDTILSNGFSISIKTYTNMKESVTSKHKIDSVTYVEHHRNWISEVKIKKSDQQIFNEKIDKDFFLKNNIQIDDDLPDAINTKVWIDEEASIEKDSISLLTVFLHLEDAHYLIYRIKIGTNGHYSLKQLENY